MSENQLFTKLKKLNKNTLFDKVIIFSDISEGEPAHI